MLVFEVMQCDVFTLKESDSLRVGLLNMLRRGVRHAPVMRDQALVGILSERNALAHRAAHARDGAVSEAMVTDPYVTDPETSLEAASALMATHQIGCLPVVVRGKLVGIITRTDLLAAFSQEPVDHSSAESECARDLMQSPVIVVRADDPLLEAAHRLLQNGIRHLPVVDGERRLLGMLSDRDVRTALGDYRHLLDGKRLRGEWEALRVGQVMTPKPIWVAQSAKLEEIGERLVNHRLGALPVLDDNERVVGIVSYVDLLKRQLRRT